MLENLDDLNTFLENRDEDAPVYENWQIKGYKLRPELIGEEGYIPEGLSRVAAKDAGDLRDHLCVTGESEKHTIFLVVNLDVSEKFVEESILSALRWQSFIDHDAIIVISRSDKKVADAAKQLQDSEILYNDAVILTHLE